MYLIASQVIFNCAIGEIIKKNEKMQKQILGQLDGICNKKGKTIKINSFYKIQLLCHTRL